MEHGGGGGVGVGAGVGGGGGTGVGGGGGGGGGPGGGFGAGGGGGPGLTLVTRLALTLGWCSQPLFTCFAVLNQQEPCGSEYQRPHALGQQQGQVRTAPKTPAAHPGRAAQSSQHWPCDVAAACSREPLE